MATSWDRRYILIFIAHIVIAGWAGASFALMPSRFVAAVTAGLGFLLLNALVAFWLRHDWKRSLIFWTNLLILLAFTLPMLILRIQNPDVPWAEVTILGLPGPTFHRLSTASFMSQIVMVLVEGFLRSRPAYFK